jgi:hypothetical protein
MCSPTLLLLLTAGFELGQQFLLCSFQLRDDPLRRVPRFYGLPVPLPPLRRVGTQYSEFPISDGDSDRRSSQ